WAGGPSRKPRRGRWRRRRASPGPRRPTSRSSRRGRRASRPSRVDPPAGEIDEEVEGRPPQGEEHPVDDEDRQGALGVTAAAGIGLHAPGPPCGRACPGTGEKIASGRERPVSGGGGCVVGRNAGERVGRNRT